ncbi:hypothetical protein FGK63_03110 [Ruegeria sediminis]|uniref:HTH OST-type domain-containing protein n=1 Tax=Ruegeria sediminis TaxID=2583820 RepID=A0ABY2X4T6_9RHOB|nr:OST-HTH/LOTUS domain-containing protein [Ruegeria sediminis]TMV10065.1 hypothetical protein FGK63_03110 [Ruegeria sediminis]
MTAFPDNALKTHQNEVQRLLGRCLLRLQAYERLLKAVIAHHEISGPIHGLKAVRDTRTESAARKTLGTLVGDLFESNVVTHKIDTPNTMKIDFPENSVSYSSRVVLNLPDVEFARIESELKEFVTLRNNLVHHFIGQHDLGSLEGCRDGRDALVAAGDQINHHYEQLREWATDMQQCRRALAEFLRSDEFREFLVNGTRIWSGSEIVLALKEAAGELAVDGWTTVAEAEEWIAERYPEQLPAEYGCSSWRQVVHESRMFELRYFTINGLRSAKYREIKRPKNSS